MADSPDATLLKRRARRRLVGAIALVVFVVVVLPLVLDQEQRPVTQALTVQIPSQNAGSFNARVVPALVVPPVSAPEGSDQSKATKQEFKSAEPSPRAVQREGIRTKPREAAQSDSVESRRAAALINDLAYFVPLGTFANSNNAKQVQDKAGAAGIASYAERIKGPQGEQIRVRAGPFSERQAAEGARDALKSAGMQVGQVARR